MSETLKELEARVRSLSPEERARLTELLLDSLRDAPLAEIEKAWKREIGERAAAYDRGELRLARGPSGQLPHRVYARRAKPSRRVTLYQKPAPSARLVLLKYSLAEKCRPARRHS